MRLRSKLRRPPQPNLHVHQLQTLRHRPTRSRQRLPESEAEGGETRMTMSYRQPPTQYYNYQPPAQYYQPPSQYQYYQPPAQYYQPPAQYQYYQPPAQYYQPPTETYSYQPPTQSYYQPPTQYYNYQPPTQYYNYQPPTQYYNYQPTISHLRNTISHPPRCTPISHRTRGIPINRKGSGSRDSSLGVLSHAFQEGPNLLFSQTPDYHDNSCSTLVAKHENRLPGHRTTGRNWQRRIEPFVFSNSYSPTEGLDVKFPRLHLYAVHRGHT